MEFEFDPGKNASNLEKHGIDFERAQALWQDVMRVEILARTTNEGAALRPAGAAHRAARS